MKDLLLDKESVDIVEGIINTSRRIVLRYDESLEKLCKKHATYTEDTLINLLAIKLKRLDNRVAEKEGRHVP